MNFRLNAVSLGIALSFSSATISAQTCLEPVKPNGYLWWSNKAYEYDTTSGPRAYPETWSYAMAAAFPAYLATDLESGVGPNGEGQVKFYNFTYGLLNAPAWARTWSGSIECTEPTGTGVWTYSGDCNSTSIRPDYGLITFNDTHLNQPDKGISLWTRVVLHEIGHVFGLGHVDPSCNSFMSVPVNTFQPADLTTLEKAWINSNY